MKLLFIWQHHMIGLLPPGDGRRGQARDVVIKLGLKRLLAFCSPDLGVTPSPDPGGTLCKDKELDVDGDISHIMPECQTMMGPKPALTSGSGGGGGGGGTSTKDISIWT